MHCWLAVAGVETPVAGGSGAWWHDSPIAKGSEQGDGALPDLLECIASLLHEDRWQPQRSECGAHFAKAADCEIEAADNIPTECVEAAHRPQ
eukprot:SAG11_NODE_3362_length_2499_cov_1.650417_2_plen_92_part_00